MTLVVPEGELSANILFEREAYVKELPVLSEEAVQISMGEVLARQVQMSLHPQEIPLVGRANDIFRRLSKTQRQESYGILFDCWYATSDYNAEHLDQLFGAAPLGDQLRLWFSAHMGLPEFATWDQPDGSTIDLRQRWRGILRDRLEQERPLSPKDDFTLHMLTGAYLLHEYDDPRAEAETKITNRELRLATALRLGNTLEAIIASGALGEDWVTLQQEDLARMINWRLGSSVMEEMRLPTMEEIYENDLAAWQDHKPTENARLVRRLRSQSVPYERFGVYQDREPSVKQLIKLKLYDAAYELFQKQEAALARGETDPVVVFGGAIRLAYLVRRGDAFHDMPPGSTWLPPSTGQTGTPY